MTSLNSDGIPEHSPVELRRRGARSRVQQLQQPVRRAAQTGLRGCRRCSECSFVVKTVVRESFGGRGSFPCTNPRSCSMFRPLSRMCAHIVLQQQHMQSQRLEECVCVCVYDTHYTDEQLMSACNEHSGRVGDVHVRCAPHEPRRRAQTYCLLFVCTLTCFHCAYRVHLVYPVCIVPEKSDACSSRPAKLDRWSTLTCIHCTHLWARWRSSL